MVKIFVFLLFATLMLSGKSQSPTKIYLIRHAKVDIKNPGWGNSKAAHLYKEQYNRSPIRNFNANEIKEKIENFETVDTVFCSPLKRATETASIIFGEGVIIKTDSVLAELDYPVVKFPAVQLPVKVWLLISRGTWTTGINGKEKEDYQCRKKELQVYSQKLMQYTSTHEVTVVLAHGMVNWELKKILKEQGWKPGNHYDFSTLSVNYFEKK
jgi:broad specificity phosphatase PhoE